MKRQRPDGSTPKVTKTRRHKGFFVFFVTFMALVLSAWAARRWWPSSYSAADGPIIVISIDTLRADHLPGYGYSKVRTPNIDALAAAGTTFERAYSHVPQTLPAHCSDREQTSPVDKSAAQSVPSQ